MYSVFGNSFLVKYYLSVHVSDGFEKEVGMGVGC